MYDIYDIEHKLTTIFAFFAKTHVTASPITASDLPKRVVVSMKVV